MKTHLAFWMSLILVTSASAIASDDVVSAAVEEDISAFDQVLSKHKKADPALKTKPAASEVGQRIASEAKKLGDSVKTDQFKNFGKKVSSIQRNGSASGGASASDRSSGKNGQLGNGNSNPNRPGKGSGKKNK